MNKVSAALAALVVGLLFAAGNTSTVTAISGMCGNTSTGHIALTDLGAGTFQGEQGGLYPGGSNTPPAAYKSAGVSAASLIVPRNSSGNPSSGGKIVFIAIGMSNTEMEFNAFTGAERSDSHLNPAVGFVNGSQGGMTGTLWASQGGVKGDPWPILEQRIAAAGYTDAQVQVAWLKEADFTFSNPSFETYAQTLSQELTQITSIAAQKYPNLRQLFVSPRTYGGYSGIYPTTSTNGPNPEPWAYETGFADKWFVAKSVANPSQRPWVGWGPYFWTDGTRGRADGLQWLCSDTMDGTHPSSSGLAKLTPMLHTLFATSPFTPWFGGSASVASNPSPLPAQSPVPTAGSVVPPGSVRATQSPVVGQASPSPVASPTSGITGAIESTVTAVTKLPPAERYSLLTVALIVVGAALAAFAFLVLGGRRRIPWAGRKKRPLAAGTNGSGPTHDDLMQATEPPPVLVGTSGQAEDQPETRP